MNCKRCGSVLPNEGYVCKECGAMMDEEQIKIQKEQIKENASMRKPKYFSDNYNIDKNVEAREGDGKSLPVAAFIIVIVFLVVISILIFLLKR